MEPIENNENLQDEVVTVTPGEEVKTVEEEMTESTPVEEKSDEEVKEESAETTEESEEKSEVVEEEEHKEEPQESEDEENKSEEVEEEKKEEEKEEEPSEDDGDKKDDEPAEEATENVEENADESPEESDKQDELDKVKAELEAMKEAEETRKMIQDRDETIEKASKDFNEFNNRLKDAILDTFKQYGIDPNTDIEELKKDPAKYQIAQDIVVNAQRIQAEKQAELMKPITDASNKIVFREAGRMMADFNLTEEQTTVCAETLINILDATGLSNLTDDLKAKVELAVARAKMIAPKVEAVVEQAKEIVEDVAQAVEDVKEEKAVKEEDVQKALEEKVEEEPEKKEPTVIEETPSLDAFKEGAAVGEAANTLGDGVDVDNVLEKLASLPFKDRTRFLVEHVDLINEAGRRRRAQGR